MAETENNGLDAQWDDQDLLSFGWIRADPLGASRAHQSLNDQSAGDASGEVGLRRERAELARELEEAERRHAGTPNADMRSLFRETATAADAVDRLAVFAGQLYVQLRGCRRGWFDYAETAAADVVQNAQTTLGAVALLLRNGYSLDAEARWRGLHELACTAALLAVDSSQTEICKRYLAHGQRLLVDDPAYGEPWVRAPQFFHRNYEWLRESYPHVNKKGSPIPFTQRWLFDQAHMTSAPFDDWLRPSHAPVHMSSEAVATGSEQAGGAPAGYSRERNDQVSWQVGCSFYELVAHVVRLPHADALAHSRRLAWVTTVHEMVDASHPGPVQEPDPLPAERLGLL